MSIIQVQNLSKSYIINHEGQERYTALRDVITNKAKKLFSFPSTSTLTSTSTSIKIKGRVASLLEVGTGFDPELTFREYIFPFRRNHLFLFVLSK